MGEAVEVLVYSGDKDYIVNWRGGEAWTNEVDWAKKDDFKNKDYEDYVVDGKKAGEYKSVDNLTFLRVFDAGHMVPMDQPEVSLNMLNKLFHKWAAVKRL